MTRAGMGALVALALAAGLALRLTRLDARPMHHDEANQALKFGALLERGEYAYDAHDHHGPTLYYLSLPAAKLRGQATLASLDERTLRGVTATFGAATILLLPLLSAGIGRTAVATSAWLLALSPAMVFYSRMFIQESLLAFFTLAFVIAVGRAATGGGLAWSAVAGVAAGLAISTKETSVIVLPAALAACAIALWSLRSGSPRDALARGRWLRAALVGIAAAAAVAALFYSSFLTAPRAVLDPFRAAGPYFDRVVAPANHVHPWSFYLGLLTYSLVRRPEVERGARARARDRRRGDGAHVLGALSRLLRDRRHGHLLVHPLQDSVERSAVLRRDDRARRNRLL